MSIIKLFKGLFDFSPKKYPYDENNRINFIIGIGRKYGWSNELVFPQNKMLSLFKKDMRINVFYTTLTVATCLNHPRHGRTQLFRKNVSPKELIEIFKNPRVHIGRGFYTK